MSVLRRAVESAPRSGHLTQSDCFWSAGNGASGRPADETDFDRRSVFDYFGRLFGLAQLREDQHDGLSRRISDYVGLHCSPFPDLLFCDLRCAFEQFVLRAGHLDFP